MNNQEYEEHLRLRGALGYLAGYANMKESRKFIGNDADLLYRFLADIAAIADGALTGKNALDVISERNKAREE